MFWKKKTNLDFAADIYNHVKKLLSRVRRQKAVGELTHVNLRDLKCTRVQVRADYAGSLKPTQITVVLDGLHSDASFKNIPSLMKAVRNVADVCVPEELKDSVKVVLAREERREESE